MFQNTDWVAVCPAPELGDAVSAAAAGLIAAARVVGVTRVSAGGRGPARHQGQQSCRAELGRYYTP